MCAFRRFRCVEAATRAAALGLIVVSSAAVGTARAESVKVCIDPSTKTYRDYDGRCATSATLTLPPSAKPPAQKSPAAVPKKSASAASEVKAGDQGAGKAASKACSEGFNTHLVIGDSFSDFNFLDTANCNPAPAKGAQFSFARDGVAHNTQWSAKGAIAEKFIWLYSPQSRPDGAYLNLLAVAPVASFQRVTNSNAKLATSQNIDVLSYGFSGEALFANVSDAFQRPWQVYARARTTANGDFEGNVKSWSATFELQPLSDFYRVGSNIPVGGVGYFWFDPLLRVQHFERLNGSTDPIFGRGNQVTRVGPAISANFIPQSSGEFDPNKPRPTPPWVLNVTYSWYRDLVHGQTFQHWNPSFTYNVTENVGFSVGYERGKVETNGKNIDLTTVSLTVKN
jgi:hypothetical protein